MHQKRAQDARGAAHLHHVTQAHPELAEAQLERYCDLGARLALIDKPVPLPDISEPSGDHVLAALAGHQRESDGASQPWELRAVVDAAQHLERQARALDRHAPRARIPDRILIPGNPAGELGLTE